MTDPIDIPSMNSDQLKAKAEEILSDAPPEVQQAVQTTRSFVEENQQLIVAAIVTVVFLKIYKRKIAKATAKEVAKVLVNTPVTIDVARYMDDYQNWYQTYQAIV